MGKAGKEPEGILQNVITFLCFKANPLSSRKLAKLVYLVDVYHYQMFGRRLTDVPFKHYYYGAWAPDIDIEIEKLCDAGIIQEKVVSTRVGYPAVIPKPAILETTIELPETGLKALESVLAEWGSASPDEVVSFTKTTLPFLNTPFDELIDFSRADPIAEYAKEQQISEEAAAMEDISSDDFLVKKALEADKLLREGSRLLRHEEVFGD